MWAPTNDAERQWKASFGEGSQNAKTTATVPYVYGAIGGGVVGEDIVPRLASLDDVSKVPPMKPVLTGGEKYLSEDLGG